MSGRAGALGWRTIATEVEALGYALGPPEGERLERLLARLFEVNRRAALTRIDTPEAAWRLHVLDALAGVRAFGAGPLPRTIIDLGSGAGFPALPLAIALPAHVRARLGAGLERIVALEARAKKCAFMRAAARELGLGGRFEVVEQRAEQAAHEAPWRERFDLATARALAPLRVLVELALPFVRPGGALVAWKGPRAEAEIAAARRAIELLGGGPPEVIPSGIAGRDLVFVRVPKRRGCPARFPRRTGVPRKRPL